MNKISFAIIGCGHIGRRHLEKISARPDAQVVALVDVLPREETIGTNEPHIPYFSSVEALLNSQIPFEIASVCTPNGLHFSIAKTLIQSGKNVLVEKPLVLFPEEGEELVQLAQKKGVQIFGVLQNRYSQASVWLKGLLEEGTLGKILSVDLECFWNRDRRYYKPNDWHGTKQWDGGTLFTQYSHFVDLLLWFFGPARIEHTAFANLNHGDMIEFEDSGWLTLKFLNSQAHGTLRYSTAVYGTNCGVRLSVLAEKGCVVLDGPFMNKVTHCQIENYQMPNWESVEKGNQYGAYSGSAQNHHIVIEQVVRAMQGLEADVVSGQEALEVVRFIRQAYASNPFL